MSSRPLTFSLDRLSVNAIIVEGSKGVHSSQISFESYRDFPILQSRKLDVKRGVTQDISSKYM